MSSKGSTSSPHVSSSTGFVRHSSCSQSGAGVQIFAVNALTTGAVARHTSERWFELIFSAVGFVLSSKIALWPIALAVT